MNQMPDPTREFGRADEEDRSRNNIRLTARIGPLRNAFHSAGPRTRRRRQGSVKSNRDLARRSTDGRKRDGSAPARGTRKKEGAGEKDKEGRKCERQTDEHTADSGGGSVAKEGEIDPSPRQSNSLLEKRHSSISILPTLFPFLSSLVSRLLFSRTLNLHPLLKKKNAT